MATTLDIARSIIRASQSNRLSQRLGRTVLAVGIAVIGSVLFGTLHITSNDPAQIAQAFVDAAAHAMAVSAVLAVVSFALVFVLPKQVEAPERASAG